MPVIIHPDKMKIHSQGEGWRITTLADGDSIGAEAIISRRWSLAPESRGPNTTHGNIEQLMYVISGSGVAVVGDDRLPLEPESMLWLEPGDEYYFEAGPLGLEILQGYPPGA